MIAELYEKRNKLVEDQRNLLDKAENEKRDFTTEENDQYNGMDKDFEKITEDIKIVEKREDENIKRIKGLEEREAYLKTSQQKPTKPATESSNDTKNQDEYRNAYRSYLMRGGNNLSETELRALQADKNVAGGYLVAPEQFVSELIKGLEDQVFVRKYAKIISMPTAASLGIPELANQIDDAAWTSELSIGDEDKTMSFNKRQMVPHPLAGYIKVSKKLLRVASVDVDAEVRDGLTYVFSICEENAFLNANGENKPLGVMYPCDHGVSKNRDVNKHNSTTDISADNLIECLYTLKAQYRKKARWTFHRDIIKKIRKLKDDKKDYLWKEGIATSRPDTILGLPYDESEYMPNVFGPKKYVGLLCDWSYYWIADAMDMSIQVLLELYAEKNQNGYIGRKETDGAPVHEQAFVRMQLL